MSRDQALNYAKKTSKLRVTGLCAGNSPGIPAQMASNAENVSIWWRHHALPRENQARVRIYYIVNSRAVNGLGRQENRASAAEVLA